MELFDIQMWALLGEYLTISMAGKESRYKLAKEETMDLQLVVKSAN